MSSRQQSECVAGNKLKNVKILLRSGHDGKVLNINVFQYRELFQYIHLSVSQSLCLSLSLSVFVSVSVSISLALSLLSLLIVLFHSLCLSLRLCLPIRSVSLSLSLSLSLSVSLSVSLSLYLSIYLSIYLPICLSLMTIFFFVIRNFLPVIFKSSPNGPLTEYDQSCVSCSRVRRGNPCNTMDNAHKTDIIIFLISG